MNFKKFRRTQPNLFLFLFHILLPIFLVVFFVNVFAHSGIERNSIDSIGTQSNDDSYNSSLSSDGRYLAFYSNATNLVSGDTNAVADVFVYDRNLDTIERVSVNNSATEGNGASYNPIISSDGRYVVFYSYATNLVASDTNAVADVFVYDRTLDTVERVSTSSLGVEGNGDSLNPTISTGGRYVSFHSNATNLVAGDTNTRRDVFVYDRDTDTIERVSVDNIGTEGNNHSANPSISSDGRYVSFHSNATNLVAGDTNVRRDVFVYDRDTDTIERVSLSTLGAEGDNDSTNAYLSSTGRYVAFYAYATNFVASDTNGSADVFVYDRDTDTVERVSLSSAGVEGNNESYVYSISGDGRYVSFYSDATNLVAGDTNAQSDVFVYDRTLDTVERVSINISGTEGNGPSYYGSLSSGGNYIAYESDATNLISGDTNVKRDIFTVYLGDGPTISNITYTQQSTSATITWTTDEVASSQVEYGTTVLYGTTTSVSDTSPRVTSHSVNISGLSSCTPYHFRVISIDSFTNSATSGDYEFVTSGGCGGGGGGGGHAIPFNVPTSVITPPQAVVSPNIPPTDTTITGDQQALPVYTISPEITNTIHNIKIATKPRDNNPTEKQNTENTVEVEVVVPEPAVESTGTELQNTLTENTKSEGGLITNVASENTTDNFFSKLNKQITQIFNTTSKSVVLAGSTAKNILSTKEGDITAKTLTAAGALAGSSITIATGLFANPLSTSEIFLIPFRLWSLMLSALGIKRKIRRWGVVYDSVTKQPLDPAYITLKNLEGKEVASTITDLDGRYGFLVNPGTYAITAGKTNYAFPSSKLAGRKNDELYDNIYWGDYFVVKGEGEVITKNIPLDPLKFDWNEFEKRKKNIMKYYHRYDLTLARMSNSLFALGFIIASTALLVTPRPYNIIIFALYILIFILRNIGLKMKKRGSVSEKSTGYPLSFGIVRVLQIDTGNEIAHSVIDERGYFYCLVQNGTYRVKIDRKNPDGTYSNIYDNFSLTVKDGVLNFNFVI